MRRVRALSSLASLAALATVAACGAPPAPVAATPTTGPTNPQPALVTEPPRPPPMPVIDGEMLRAIAMTKAFRRGTPTMATPTPDGKAVLFLRSGARAGMQTLFETDLASGATREVLTPEMLAKGAETLSLEERARRERMRISATGFTSFALSSDGSRVLVMLGGRLFVVPRGAGAGAAIELKTGKGMAFDPRFSPDGKRVAFVRDNNLYTVGVDGSPEVAVTKGGTETKPNGTADFIAEEELDRHRGYFWSPDSTQLLYEAPDVTKVERLTIADPAHPEREPDRPFYPRPGKTNAELKFGLVSARGGATTWVAWERERFPYVATIGWDKGATGPALVVLDRLQKNAVVLAVDAKSGKTRALVTEHDDAWVNVDPSVPAFLADGSFVWSSDRSGVATLELHDAKGKWVRALTPKVLPYQRLAHIDEKKHVVFFEASDEPSERSLYKVSLDGGETPKPERVLGAKGTFAEASFGDAGDVFIATVSTTKDAPKRFAQNVDGTVTRELPSVGETPKDLHPIEVIKVGPDEMRAIVVRPRSFDQRDPRRRYPVIDAAYAGPHAQVVKASAQTCVLPQWMADATDSIVVLVDAKGTPNRGRAWERALENKLGSVPLEGHVAALKALGATYPEMDLTRVGVYGWSFGGYFSAYATLARPDVYKAGAAGAPPIDWRDYDTAYTERYLGLPEANAAAYDAASVLSLVKKGDDANAKRSHLLVVHGTADDNVFFFNSMKLVDALERAAYPYAFMPLPGATHQVADPDQNERTWSRIAQFFRETL